MQSKKKEEYQIRNNEQKESKSEYPALVAQWDYEQQIQVAALNDEPTVDRIPLGTTIYI